MNERSMVVLWSSSVILRKCLEMFGNVCLAFGTILQKSLAIFGKWWKSLENHRKRRNWHVYIINKIIHGYL